MSWQGRLLVVLLVVQGIADGEESAATPKIFWISGGSNIWRANLNGSDKELIITGLTALIDLEVDTSGCRVYWSSSDTIQRANLDSSEQEDIHPFGASGLAIDEFSKKLYWSHLGVIQRSELDGTNLEVVIPNAEARAVSLDLVNGKIYWTAGGWVRRANLDGSNVEDVVEEPQWLALSVAVDGAEGKVYWVACIIPPPPGGHPGAVRRSNLDGSSLETIVDIQEFDTPRWIAVDPAAGYVYWSEQNGNDIRRANLDGSNNVMVVSGSIEPRGIGLYLPCCRSFGDVFPINATTGCVVDVDDLVCVLDEFVFLGTCPGADIYPCGGDGLVDVDDIVAELEAFIGYAACETKCP